MTHVLLTRSPLSPGPKPRISLDLHVLSAPPAFVLSQDQTLREDWFAGSAGPRATCRQAFTSSLCSKVASEDATGSLGRPPLCSSASRAGRAISTYFTLLSFQGPAAALRTAQKSL